MIRRHLQGPLLRAAEGLPVVSLTGPRQSGKTTLARSAFPGHAYASLEDPSVREFALADPRSFLRGFSGSVVLDEVQRAPDLFSYIQVLVDEDPRPGRFILTGSEHFLLSERISQSLAGRCAVLHLLPFSLGELAGRPPIDPTELEATSFDRISAAPTDASLEEVLFRGFYPRVHHEGIDARTWLAGYELTYVERDVRQIINIGQLEAFRRFVRLCAARTGALVNHASVASATGISAPTARSWLSVLEASFLLRSLPPHHANFSKRLVKSPKLYFLDTGLLCLLLGLRSPEDLRYHPLRGEIFETLVVSELFKAFLHLGHEPPLYFWRDRTGHEVDLLVDLGSRLVPWEIKSTDTLRSSLFDGLRWWQRIAGEPHARGGLIHGGDRNHRREEFAVRSWRFCS